MMNNESFRAMRRSRQLLSEEESIRLLTSATAGVLSLVGDDGYPYGVPLSHVYSNGKLYFHSALSGHKVDAVKACAKASFTVIAADDVKPSEFTTYFRSVICFGKVRLIEEETEKMAALRELVARFNPDEGELNEEIRKGFARLVMIEFAIEHISGKEAIELVRARKA